MRTKILAAAVLLGIPLVLLNMSFFVSSCASTAARSLCPLNYIGLLLILLVLGGTSFLYTKILKGTLSLSNTVLLSMITGINLLQLTMATEINDTINLWFANQKNVELTIYGILAVLLVVLPYVLLSITVFRSDKNSSAPPARVGLLKIATTALTLLIAIYYSFSRQSLNPTTFHFFDFSFIFQDLVSTSFALALALSGVTYFFTKKFINSLQLLHIVIPSAIWSLYTGALFNTLYFLLSNKNFAFRKSYAVVLTIIFLIFISQSVYLYLRTVFQNNSSFPVQKVKKIALTTSILYVIIQFTFSILLRL
jgi:hypothetical protein